MLYLYCVFEYIIKVSNSWAIASDNSEWEYNSQWHWLKINENCFCQQSLKTVANCHLLIIKPQFSRHYILLNGLLFKTFWICFVFNSFGLRVGNKTDSAINHLTYLLLSYSLFRSLAVIVFLNIFSKCDALLRSYHLVGYDSEK